MKDEPEGPANSAGILPPSPFTQTLAESRATIFTISCSYHTCREVLGSARNSQHAYALRIERPQCGEPIVRAEGFA